MSEPTNILEFSPRVEGDEHKPMFARAGYEPGRCTHEGATFLVDSWLHRVTCSLCKEAVEAFEVINQLSQREYRRARKENADVWHRQQAEEEAEKQAKKTRKAAYETLYRFGVTPEMYAEEYRRKCQLSELELKQDYSRTLAFEGQQ